jgi:MFS family permease
MALSVLDSAIANIALPAIAKEIHASPADSIWVINAYQLAVVISLLPFASLGDIFDQFGSAVPEFDLRGLGGVSFWMKVSSDYFDLIGEGTAVRLIRE